MRNVKFAGELVKQYDKLGKQYDYLAKNRMLPSKRGEKVAERMNRIRHVLEKRYNTIV